MKTCPRKAAAFTWVELLFSLVIIAVLVSLAVPSVTNGPCNSPMAGTLSNARQLHLATQTMTLDNYNAGVTGPSWTSIDAGDHKTYTPVSVAVYFDALVKNGYLSENDLKKLVAAPGKGPGWGHPTAGNSCFEFFPVDEKSPADQPLMVTANWDHGTLTTDAPYGKKGFVVFTKGGSGGIYSRTTDPNSSEVFPMLGSEIPSAYRYAVLK